MPKMEYLEGGVGYAAPDNLTNVHFLYTEVPREPLKGRVLKGVFFSKELALKQAMCFIEKGFKVQVDTYKVNDQHPDAK